MRFRIVMLIASAGVVGLASAAAAQPADGPVTFAEHVAPIFYERCTTCHRPGQVGPMSLLTYADARPWARSIRQKVVAREMPPWDADSGHRRLGQRPQPERRADQPPSSPGPTAEPRAATSPPCRPCRATPAA